MDGSDDKKFLMGYCFEDPNTWTRQQLVNAVNYYRAKIKRVRQEYETLLEAYENE